MIDSHSRWQCIESSLEQILLKIKGVNSGLGNRNMIGKTARPQSQFQNFHIHVSASDSYILRIGPHISSRRIGRSLVGIYKSLTHKCGHWDCVAERFPFWEYLSRIFGIGTLQCSLLATFDIHALPIWILSFHYQFLFYLFSGNKRILHVWRMLHASGLVPARFLCIIGNNFKPTIPTNPELIQVTKLK